MQYRESRRLSFWPGPTGLWPRWNGRTQPAAGPRTPAAAPSCWCPAPGYTWKGRTTPAAPPPRPGGGGKAGPGRGPAHQHGLRRPQPGGEGNGRLPAGSAGWKGCGRNSGRGIPGWISPPGSRAARCTSRSRAARWSRTAWPCFPDAPTLRGLKHLRTLTALAGQGARCCVLVVIQMQGVCVCAQLGHPARVRPGAAAGGRRRRRDPRDGRRRHPRQPARPRPRPPGPAG